MFLPTWTQLNALGRHLSTLATDLSDAEQTLVQNGLPLTPVERWNLSCRVGTLYDAAILAFDYEDTERPDTFQETVQVIQSPTWRGRKAPGTCRGARS